MGQCRMATACPPTMTLKEFERQTHMTIRRSQVRRPADVVLADLDVLRDRRYSHQITEQEYREQHDILWDELKEGDWERREANDRRLDRAKDGTILQEHGYRSIKEALADGWMKLLPTYGLVGGDRITLTHHTLVKGFQRGYSESYWKSLGYRIRSGELPAGQCLAAYGGGWFAIYTDHQVENTERILRREAMEKKQGEMFVVPRLLDDLLALVKGNPASIMHHDKMGHDWRMSAKEEFDALKVWQMPTLSDLKEFSVSHFQEGHTVEDVCFISGLPVELVSKWHDEPDRFDRGLSLWQHKLLETIPGWKELYNKEEPGCEKTLPVSKPG